MCYVIDKCVQRKIKWKNVQRKINGNQTDNKCKDEERSEATVNFKNSWKKKFKND